jgi:hypothetical protein
MLNFKRNRFFPNLQSVSHVTYTNLSLGMFSRFFNKGKSFIKNKNTFLTVAGFMRKILLYSLIGKLILMVKRTPLYFQEILAHINNPVVTPYKHPFYDDTVDEFFLKKSFSYLMFIFINSKPYTFMKSKRRGRVKRKITRRLVKINRLVD